MKESCESWWHLRICVNCLYPQHTVARAQALLYTRRIRRLVEDRRVLVAYDVDAQYCRSVTQSGRFPAIMQPYLQLQQQQHDVILTVEYDLF